MSTANEEVSSRKKGTGSVSISVASVGEIVWLLGIVAWFVIRYPFERRAKRVKVLRDARTRSDRTALALAFFGLAVLPGFYVATGIPQTTDYVPSVWAIAIGTVILLLALWVFRRSHKELGRNWSITLEIREKHKLVTSGPYAFVRHPMYTSFLLMALSQALLLANWLVGPMGLIGLAILFFLRVNKEERMMLENFGPQYQDYMTRTKRIIPYIY